MSAGALLLTAIYLFMAVFFAWVAIKAGEPRWKSILMGRLHHVAGVEGGAMRHLLPLLPSIMLAVACQLFLIAFAGIRTPEAIVPAIAISLAGWAIFSFIIVKNQ